MQAPFDALPLSSLQVKLQAQDGRYNRAKPATDRAMGHFSRGDQSAPQLWRLLGLSRPESEQQEDLRLKRSSSSSLLPIPSSRSSPRATIPSDDLSPIRRILTYHFGQNLRRTEFFALIGKHTIGHNSVRALFTPKCFHITILEFAVFRRFRGKNQAPQVRRCCRIEGVVAMLKLRLELCRKSISYTLALVYVGQLPKTEC